jgi:hypothetical protein
MKSLVYAIVLFNRQYIVHHLLPISLSPLASIADAHRSNLRGYQSRSIQRHQRSLSDLALRGSRMRQLCVCRGRPLYFPALGRSDEGICQY